MRVIIKGEEKKIRVLYTEKEIQEKVKSLAKEITAHYKKLLKKNETIVIVPILEGAIFFAIDLLKELRKFFPSDIFEFDSLSADSYPNSTIPEKTKIVKDLKKSPRGKHVLVIEDIVDTGNTLVNIKKYLKSKKVKSLTLAVLIEKSPSRQKNIKIDFTGFKVEKSLWLIGYGLDLAGYGRTLPDICYFEE